MTRFSTAREYNIFFILAIGMTALPIVLLLAFVMSMVSHMWIDAIVEGSCLLVYGIVIAFILEPIHKKFWKYYDRSD